MLMRIDPFREFDRLIDRHSAPRNAFPMDATREGDAVNLAIDVPGVNPDDIEVTVEKDVLTVKATRITRHSGEVETILAERPRGSFTRRVFLGRQLDGERLTASYENGVLYLTVPVADSAKPRRITVSTTGPDAIEEVSTPEAA